MTRKFAKKADDPTTKEFRLLQEVMATYPNYRVVNHTIKKNPNKECYRGLTYEYMKSYIERYETDVDSALKELDNMIFDSKCHSKGYRYPTVKKWFLNKYPEVAKFGVEFEKIEEVRPLITKVLNQNANLKSETEAA